METSDCPLPLKHIDVTRATYTDLNMQTEVRITDVWSPGEVQKELSAPWKGKPNSTCYAQSHPTDASTSKAA
jgi:hypothetical protein